ncbi:TetR/AcrR family transcriptional regulator [Sphingomonas adhaesiva]|uniref:TetR/AcrR family transcriptional regulator n=1 Tax=Sphingomonas adhaesiva TaxID=28212 RepID=UPI002FF8BC76
MGDRAKPASEMPATEGAAPKRPSARKKPIRHADDASPKDAPEELVNIRRRQDRSIATRQKILASGLEEFSQVGFGGATTRSIAKRADVPHGLVIYHFETKLGVWQAVVEKAVADLHVQFVETIEQLRGSDPETILRTVYGDFIRTSGSRPELGWLFSHEFADQSERAAWILDQVRGHDLTLTLDLIRGLQAAGRFIKGDPAHLHFLFIGAATRVFGLASEIEHHVGTSPFDPAFIEAHIDLCLRLFFQSHGTS